MHRRCLKSDFIGHLRSDTPQHLVQTVCSAGASDTSSVPFKPPPTVLFQGQQVHLLARCTRYLHMKEVHANRAVKCLQRQTHTGRYLAQRETAGVAFIDWWETVEHEEATGEQNSYRTWKEHGRNMYPDAVSPNGTVKFPSGGENGSSGYASHTGTLIEMLTLYSYSTETSDHNVPVERCGELDGCRSVFTFGALVQFFAQAYCGLRGSWCMLRHRLLLPRYNQGGQSQPLSPPFLTL